MSDRNRGRRFDVDWFVRAYHVQSSSWIWGRTENVSVSGLLFLSPLPFQIGDTVQLDIMVDKHTVVKCLVRVVREGPVRAGYHTYGAIFNHFVATGRQVLSELLLAKLRAEWSGSPGGVQNSARSAIAKPIAVRPMAILKR